MSRKELLSEIQNVKTRLNSLEESVIENTSLLTDLIKYLKIGQDKNIRFYEEDGELTDIGKNFSHPMLLDLTRKERCAYAFLTDYPNGIPVQSRESNKPIERGYEKLYRLIEEKNS